MSMVDDLGTRRHHVVVATDERYAMPTAVTLRSLLIHGGGPFHVTVLHDSISEETRNRILRSLPASDVEVSWVDAGDLDVRASRRTHLTVATYFRIWVADVVPAAAELALYLDVDLIVRRDLAELWAWDLNGCAVAAVQSVNYPFVATHGAVNDWPLLGLAPDTPFFNAGVLLIDLDRWRSEEVKRRALEYLRSPHLGAGADQEALNATLAGRWSQLPPVWNQQTEMLSHHQGADLLFPHADLRAARDDPAIVHFQAWSKPWHRGSRHPFQGEWSQHAARVHFEKVSNIRERSLRDEARWRVRRAACALVRGR
jgi:lipopolysaccharide biosynthesis glycosyltransferase